MKNFRLIEDLKIKVSAYQKSYENRSKGREDKVCQLIAELLFEAEIYPYQLCSETVGKILAGDILWPGEEGQVCHRNLAPQKVSTLDELESAYLARFINHELRFVSVPADSEDYPEGNRKLIKTVRCLQDMIWGRNGFVSQHLRIQKDKAEHLLYQHGVCGTVCDFLIPSKDYFSFRLGRSDCGPVGGKLWSIILHKTKGNEAAVSDWLRLIGWAFQDGYWGDFQFKNEAEKTIFLDLGVETILNEPDLVRSWEDEFYMQTLEGCRNNDILRWKNYKEMLSPELPETFLEDDFTGLFLYASRLEQNLSFPEMRSKISALLNVIIENEELHIGKNSFQRTQKLIDGSYKRPGLFQMLTLPYRVSNLTYYFMYRREYVVIGMFHIIVNGKGPQSYYGEKDYSLYWQRLIWSQCLDIFSNHIAGDKSDAQLCLNLISKLAEDSYSPPRDGFYQGLHYSATIILSG
ncbi:hypothetical protein [Desulfobacter curvatus]|uniref:hypothetical protein n=1 Tax=Desulfobacter curvatus TaxID=2290 RepID=UPI00037D3527|nr:hypothetical protein [Desulfobacter curvatus]